MPSRVMLVIALFALPIACDGWDGEPEVEPGSTSSGMPLTQIERDCAGMCGHAISNGCEPGDCAERCVYSVNTAGDCFDVTHTYVACLSREGLESCTTVPPACQSAYDAWSSCAVVEGGCSPVQCVDPEQLYCKCQATCDSKLVVEACVEVQDGFYCTCEVDGTVVRECLDPLISCAFFIGCCAPEVQVMMTQ